MKPRWGMFFPVSMLRSALVLVTVLLSGCAGFIYSEADCKKADWRALGYDHGYFGSTPQITRLQYDCGSHGIAVAETEYFAGWKDGYDEWDRLIGSHRKMGR